MLIQEQRELLQWIGQKPDGVTFRQMEEQEAPGFTEERIRYLVEQGYLIRKPIDFFGNWAGCYSLSDKGRVALQEVEEKLRKETEDKKQRRFENKVSIAQIVVPVITFVLGLLVEHYTSVVDFVTALFQ